MNKMGAIINKCWHAPKHIFTTDKVDYYAADEHGINKFKGDLIINLTSIPNVPQIIPPELKEHYDLPYEEIMVPWPDFGKPKVKMSFWETIHRIIKYKKYKTVCIHCGHGHGRTGTAMSCILVAICGTSAIEAVDTIRENHCWEAVETAEQCHYIMEVDNHYNGRELIEKNFPLPSTMINWEEIEYEKEEEEIKNKFKCPDCDSRIVIENNTKTDVEIRCTNESCVIYKHGMILVKDGSGKIDWAFED